MILCKYRKISMKSVLNIFVSLQIYYKYKVQSNLYCSFSHLIRNLTNYDIFIYYILINYFIIHYYKIYYNNI